ncbi:glycoside hydrolase family protein [Thalassococcus sp. S3]|uniref:glycoside hydrolase family protein n=1 Tax=Thalassococcus sp. S3 TaxID=2017482 RepID=UPI00102417CB|nr:peptidoglycan-binding protein [Thalassococcus sp. S3]QBF31517.1 lysozyme [Thalassococcus sp. S3]
MRKISEAGLAFLEAHEGVVLKAYRCPAGIWTIGAGLTKASGVITPRPGMILTRHEASEFLSKALERNYEPRVRKAMPGAAQNEFDGGVSFDFNTGAVLRASWVAFWRRGDHKETRRRLGLWNKGGGRVLKGLVRRRREEADLILNGNYHGHQKRVEPLRPPSKDHPLARIVVKLGDGEMAEIREGLKKLGYAAGSDEYGLRQTAVRDFQRDHDLTVDGIIGPATLATLQRMIDARRKPVIPATATATAAGGGAGLGATVPGPAADMASDLALAGSGGGLLWLAWLAWQYRDAIAAQVQASTPRLAAALRSV